MAIVPPTTATVPRTVVAVTFSLPRKKIIEITRLKSGVVATIGETMTTRPLVSAIRVSKAPSASKKPDRKKQ